MKLWTLQAAQLLAANDVGLIPWVPLTQFVGPREALLQECRQRIDVQAPPEERDNLLAVTQVMTRLRYNDPQLMPHFGGKKAMIDAPLIQELLAETPAETRAETQGKDILRFLSSRFGLVPPEIVSALARIHEEPKLDNLVEWAARCPDLEAFRARLV